MRTPLLRWPHERDREIYLKLESTQPMGAFKIRGAYNRISRLTDAEKRRGVITFSSGNHAQAVAYAAREVGAQAVIIMPDNAPKVKVDGTRALGGEVVFVGPASSERQAKAEELVAKHDYVVIPPYDDPHIIAGQGTCGLEIVEDLPDAEVVLAPVSGGGLLSGVATAVKLSRPDVKVIGVEPELAADTTESFRKGEIVEWPAERTSRTICDGLRTQSVGKLPFEHIRKYVDDIVNVSEDEVREAMRQLVLRGRVVAEPSGAASFAALLFHSQQLPRAKRYVAIISGGNTEPAFLADVIAAHPGSAPAAV